MSALPQSLLTPLPRPSRKHCAARYGRFAGLGAYMGPHVGSPFTLAIRGYGSMMPISASREPLGKHGPSCRRGLGGLGERMAEDSHLGVTILRAVVEGLV